MLEREAAFEPDDRASRVEIGRVPAQRGELGSASGFVARLVEHPLTRGADLVAADHNCIRVPLRDRAGLS